MFFDEFNTMPPEFFHKLTNRTDVRWPPSGATEYLSTEPRELPE